MLLVSHKPSESLPIHMCYIHLSWKKQESVETILSHFMGCRCTSQSSVAIGPKEIKKQRAPELIDQDNKLRRKGKENADGSERRNMWAALEFPELRISERVNFLMMRFKAMSHLFVDKEEIEEIEMEMQIGLPTDVKHVTHIGWDGTTTVNPIMGWENLKAPELLSFPSISLNEFDIAMSAQAREPLVFDTSTTKSAL